MLKAHARCLRKPLQVYHEHAKLMLYSVGTFLPNVVSLFSRLFSIRSLEIDNPLYYEQHQN